MCMNLKESREGYMKVQREEREGKYCNYIIISNVKRNLFQH